MNSHGLAPVGTCTENPERVTPPHRPGQHDDVESTSSEELDSVAPLPQFGRRDRAAPPREQLLDAVLLPCCLENKNKKAGDDLESVHVVPSAVLDCAKHELKVEKALHMLDDQASSTSPVSLLSGCSGPISPNSLVSLPISSGSRSPLRGDPAAPVSPSSLRSGPTSPWTSEYFSELSQPPSPNANDGVRGSTYNPTILGHVAGSASFNPPRLRSDWGRHQAGQGDPLVGSVTSHEALWAVILTMGIGGMRTKLLADKNVEMYILYFFSFWGVVSAGINYSQVFNDDDAFHKILWSLFTLGMAGQVAYLYQSIVGFAVSTGGLYLLIVAAHCRVSYALPRARMFCAFRAVGHLVAMCIFWILASARYFTDIPAHSVCERALMWAHVCVEPLTNVAFLICTRSPQAKEKWDIPLNHEYMICRDYGLHITVIAVSVMFPLGLAGEAFVSSTTNAIVILFAIVYAVWSKLVIVDCAFPVRRHALQSALHRSRAWAVMYLLGVPWSLLGLSFTGVGLVAVVEDVCPSFAKSLIWHGTTLSACMLIFGKALHQAHHVPVYRALLATLALFTGIYVTAPYVQAWNLLPTVVTAVIFMGTLWASQILLHWFLSGALPENWLWSRPRLLVDQEQVQDGTFVGANVNSQEYLFSVFVAACVYQLNGDLRVTGDFHKYILYFAVFYLVLWASMQYAARFNDDDAAHKVLWMLFTLGLLLMLMGLTAPGQGIFRCATSGVFLLLCVAFFARAAVRIRRARCFAFFFAAVGATCAVLSLMACLFSTYAHLLIWMLVAVCALSDAAFAGLTVLHCDWDVPYNIEYVIARFNGLFMDVLGVAVIVPNALYPGNATHPNYVAVCDALAVVLAVCMKAGNFDVEATSFERHALRQSKIKAVGFVNLQACLIMAVGAVGAGTPLLIASAGQGGAAAKNAFAQQLTCIASCIFMVALTLIKLLHRPKFPRIVAAKVGLQSVGAGLNLVPLIIGRFGDFVTLAWLVGVNMSIVLVQLLCDARAERQSRSPFLLA